MEKFKSNVIKIAIGGVALFTFGIFVGYQLNFGAIASIQGYLFNAVGEATNSNASDSNASDSNASDSNASDANASSANASATDNIIYLQNFALGSSSVKAGDKVNVTIATSGACNSAVSIVFKDANDITFTAQVQNITGNPYIVVPNSAVATTYSVTDILLVGRNSDNSTFTKQYSTSGANSYNFNSILIVTSNSTNNGGATGIPVVPKITLNSVSLTSSSAKISDKVYINVSASEKLSSLKLVFTSADNKTFNVYTKNLATSKPYIEIPSSVVGGTYTLTGAVLSTSETSVAYSKDGLNNTEKFDFNSTLEISDGKETTFIYNNEDVTSEILTTLYNAPSGTEITINADSNTLINEELFNAIKGKNKTLTINYKDNQILFNGNNITDSKTIDITITANNVSRNEDISKLVSNGIVVNFPDNGNLPGKALVRIKATDDVSRVLNDNVYVYIYNESSNDFCVVDTSVEKTIDEYYEFTITHNSAYLIVNEKLDSSLVVSQSDSNIVSFQKGDKTYLMLIAIAIVVIVAVVIVTVVLKKKEKDTSSKITKIDNDMNNHNNL